MNIKIYQINMDRDKSKVAFLSFDSYAKQTGQTEIDSDIYDCVYEGEVEDSCTLEDLYFRFNSVFIARALVDPETSFRCMSVSDVIEVKNSTEIENGYYYCDSVGFQKVKFGSATSDIRIIKHGDPERAKKSAMRSFRFCCDACGCEFEARQQSVISVVLPRLMKLGIYEYPYICRVSKCPECESWVNKNNWNE